MTQLKTLKDLEFNEDEIETNVNIKGDNIVYSEDLKQEAIKWIKELKKDIKSLENNIKQRIKLIEDNIKLPQGTLYEDNLLPKLNSELQNKYAIINWIKHFFDIEL